MRFNVNINQGKCKKHSLTVGEGALMDCLNQLSSWANDVVLDGKTYYHISRNKVIEELPFFYKQPDTVYRSFKSLEKKELIEYRTHHRKDLVRLTALGKGWNKLGNKSELTPNSEMNPTKLGNESELTDTTSSPINPKKSANNSEMNPTYNINNTTNDNSEGEILLNIRKENTILFESIFNSELFKERIIKMLHSENIKKDFQKDLVPVLQHWIKNKWTANDLDRPANRLRGEAASYVKSVLKNGGLKKQSNQEELKPVYRRKIS